MNDSSLALLALVAEQHGATGYGLAAVARSRGMARWAGLSPSSIYQGLRRLEAAGLVRAGAAPKVRGRGPPGRSHALTAAGSRALRRHLSEGLLAGPEQSTRFRLALAFVEVVGAEAAARQLEARAQQLEARLAEVQRASARQAGGGAPGRALVFAYVLHGLRQERAVASRLAALVERWRRR